MSIKAIVFSSQLDSMNDKPCTIKQCTAKIIFNHQKITHMEKRIALEIRTETSPDGKVILHFKMSDGCTTSIVMPANKVYELLMMWVKEFPDGMPKAVVDLK